MGVSRARQMIYKWNSGMLLLVWRFLYMKTQDSDFYHRNGAVRELPVAVSGDGRILTQETAPEGKVPPLVFIANDSSQMRSFIGGKAMVFVALGVNNLFRRS